MRKVKRRPDARATAVYGNRQQSLLSRVIRKTQEAESCAQMLRECFRRDIEELKLRAESTRYMALYT